MRPIDMSEWDSYMSDMLDSRNVYDSYDKGYMDAMDNVDDWLDAQPAVTLDDLRPHGRWIGKNSPYDVNIHICSECREQVSILGNKLRFCPNCGAKMDLKEGGSDA